MPTTTRSVIIEIIVGFSGHGFSQREMSSITGVSHGSIENYIMIQATVVHACVSVM